MNLRPLPDKVIIKRRQAEEVTKGGIIVPEVAREKPGQGEVVALGATLLESGRAYDPGYAVGDKVVFVRFNAREIEIDGEQYVTVRNDDVLGVIER